jgi:hypothetical protein
MKKCCKINSKKILFFCLFFLFIPTIWGRNLLLEDIQIHYLHFDNEDQQVEGSTLEHHFQSDNDYYIFSRLYDEDQELYKKRRLKFDKNGKLLNFYEIEVKKEITTFNQYLPQESVFYKKEEGKIKIEKFEKGVFTIEKLFSWLTEKIISGDLTQETLTMYLPHTPLLSKAKIIIDCEKKKKNPYLGKKTPVISCEVSPKSRTLRLALGKKSKSSFIFQQSNPYFLITLLVGEKTFYIKDSKKIAEEKAMLLQEVEDIEQDIQNTFFENL